ncbi:hypothetical protein BC937DRAFT_87311, partial [Endogone sp. FLAS-F59071]
RSTGISCGNWEIDVSVVRSLTDNSITEASIAEQIRIQLKQRVNQYSPNERALFLGYMKSALKDIPDQRQIYFPHIWFDRQLAVRFQIGDVIKGDSGATIVDENGKALGMLHANWSSSYYEYAIVSPYFAVCEALGVSIEI